MIRSLLLRDGPLTAMTIGRRLGFAHEEVYRRLIRLEALGILRCVVKHGKRVVRTWEVVR